MSRCGVCKASHQSTPLRCYGCEEQVFCSSECIQSHLVLNCGGKNKRATNTDDNPVSGKKLRGSKSVPTKANGEKLAALYQEKAEIESSIKRVNAELDALDDESSDSSDPLSSYLGYDRHSEYEEQRKNQQRSNINRFKSLWITKLSDIKEKISALENGTV